MINVKEYENGLRLIVESIPAYESVAFHMLVKTGSINETVENYGISHYIEHMLFKGTDNRSAFEIVKTLDSIGANVNAYTDRTETVYYTKSTAEHTEECVEILADMFFNSKFDSKEMESEKNVVCEEISMYNDDPNALCEKNGNGIFYNGTEYARDIAGEKESVKAIAYQKIKDYMFEFYTPKNTVLSFAGNITIEQADEFVHKYFLHKFKSSNKQVNRNIVSPIIKENCIKAFKDNEQSALYIGYPALYGDDERKYVLKLFNIAWGGGMSSKLFQTIREKLGLVYGIDSTINFNDAGGNMSISLLTTSKNVIFALKSIKEEIRKIIEKGITQEEFICAKSNYVANIKLSYENTSVVSLSNARRLASYNTYLSKEALIEKIDKITIEDCNKIAKQIYDTDKFVISYVGNNTDLDLLNAFKS